MVCSGCCQRTIATNWNQGSVWSFVRQEAALWLVLLHEWRFEELELAGWLEHGLTADSWATSTVCEPEERASVVVQEFARRTKFPGSVARRCGLIEIGPMAYPTAVIGIG